MRIKKTASVIALALGIATFASPAHSQTTTLTFSSWLPSHFITQVLNEFGADLEKAGLLQFPTVMGGVVPVINVEGVKPGDVVLDGKALADIFMGKIKTWNDPAVVKLNASVKLPAQPIVVVHRSDGSGTTFLFTDYLSKVNVDWKSKVGANTAVEWPVGIGAKGNEGVANNVGQTKGSIGYVEYAYAKQNKLVNTKLVNKDGKTVAPTAASFMAAAAAADWEGTPGFGVVLTDEPGADSWPLNTPRDSMTLWTTYLFDKKWEIGGGPTYQGLRYANNTNTVIVPDFIRFDATVAYKMEKYDIRLNVFNLTNVYYIEQVMASDGGRGGTLVALPRTSENTAVAPAGRQVPGVTADQVVVPAGGGARDSLGGGMGRFVSLGPRSQVGGDGVVFHRDRPATDPNRPRTDPLCTPTPSDTTPQPTPIDTSPRRWCFEETVRWVRFRETK